MYSSENVLSILKKFYLLLGWFLSQLFAFSSWKVGFKTQFLSHQGVWIITSVVTGTNYSTFNRAIIRAFEMFKNFTLNNNRKEIDVTKNGKNFQAPRVQSRSVQTPSVQAFRVQVSTSCIQSPVFLVCILLRTQFSFTRLILFVSFPEINCFANCRLKQSIFKSKKSKTICM